MRRITLWLFSTVAALVLLVSYRTSTNGAAAATPVAEAPLTTATEPPVASPAPSAAPPSAAPSSAARTYTGSVAQTRWGPVQVTITVSGGRITEVAVPVYPNGNHRDQEINAYALPVLRQETLAAQGAAIDTVSGATVTSDGYVESLQAALDAAHL
ncbi:FMN-binding protein [Nucisporomicrobium flavum]|uniref:FMN-binding protein n=1 Tax=Nucisporomicrobium flavum TaxID=2785915 RepID=UPI0018F36104|nr:FMN-binding protein [Nucisporomicrobium flavum]